MLDAAEMWDGGVGGEGGGKKSNRGFERSPEKALRCYLAKSIMLHRMWRLAALNQIMHPGNCSHIRNTSTPPECPFTLPHLFEMRDD